MFTRALPRVSHLARTQFVPVARCFSSAGNGTLVIADHNDGKLNDATLSCVTAATKFSGDVSVLVAGSGCGEIAAQAAKIAGVSSVLVADDEAFAHGVAENVTQYIVGLQEEKSFANIIASTSAYGKSIVPRVGALLDVAPITDIIEVQSEDTFVRPVYAGNALATVQSSDSTKVMTIRPTNFDKAETGGSASVVETAVADADAGLSKWVRDELTSSDRPELASADTVVSGGRGLGSGENFGILEELADVLGAAVGASRAAVDAGYCPNDMQVGQTGKVVAPDLYVAVGISGAIQHLAGMKDSKTIVAINKDPEAPIFQVADYGLVGDLFEAVPELTAKIKASQ